MADFALRVAIKHFPAMRIARDKIGQVTEVHSATAFGRAK